MSPHGVTRSQWVKSVNVMSNFESVIQLKISWYIFHESQFNKRDSEHLQRIWLSKTNYRTLCFHCHHHYGHHDCISFPDFPNRNHVIFTSFPVVLLCKYILCNHCLVGNRRQNTCKENRESYPYFARLCKGPTPSTGPLGRWNHNHTESGAHVIFQCNGMVPPSSAKVTVWDKRGGMHLQIIRQT